MMLEPSIDVLQEKIKSKYTLVTLSAKRARQLLQTNSPLIEDSKSNKLVGVALEEIKSGDIYVKQD
ncbi:DNA-directed RNA polymerase [Lentibacillus sp. JNUCC-1]|uniref:DNA-directed RNA polymerase subunit omega n=1 Tax=Lentibacillus sp. JNUCC-1 TaxID=2654513 RepID=UPI0012E74FF4|nr:DNA-directed RNA polymerase subunit omega [Lentibacillus sp. JNUCC-1]MUV40021.1 DNA-directed RNA polymerase [Lentibacillus sp. JNUCC-1]